MVLCKDKTKYLSFIMINIRRTIATRVKTRHVNPRRTKAFSAHS